jgi:hypothetical protein
MHTISEYIQSINLTSLCGLLFIGLVHLAILLAIKDVVHTRALEKKIKNLR